MGHQGTLSDPDRQPGLFVGSRENSLMRTDSPAEEEGFELPVPP
jgi:hypothetical protein